MLQRYKRLLAGVMTVAMIFSILPMQVYAAWWEDKDQNKVILQELTEFWKDEKTAQEAMELLRKYGLIDEDGNVLTDWSKDMYIQEESRSLTIAQVRAMEEGIVTVHDRSCDAAGLNAVLNRMEALGLLENDAPVTDWKLQADGEAVSPAYLAAAQTASAVTVLGKTVDSGELLAVIEFLSQYGLLTETGAAEDWDLTLPGGSRPTNVTELLQLLEDKKDKKVDPDILITVDGTPITLSDFEIMMQIETEVKRIRETYFQDEVDMTQAQLSSLYSLYEQLSVNGIQLYNTYAADNLVFPSKIDQRVRLTMEVDSSTPLPVTANNGAVKLKFTLDRTVEHEVSFRVRTLDGSAKAGVQYEAFDKTVTIDAGKQETSVTINLEAFQPSWTGTDVWSGERVFYVQASEVKGALFGEDASSAIQQISIKSNLTFPTASLNKSSGLDSTGATSVTVSFSDAEKYMLKNNLVSHMDFSCAPDFIYTHANGANINPMRTYYAYQSVTVGNDDRRFSAYATMYAKLTLGGTTFVNETRGYQGGPLSALGLLSQTAREWYDAEGKGQASQYAIADGKQHLSLTSGISPTDTISTITKNDIDISALDVSTGLSVSSYGTVTGAYVVYWSFPDDEFYNVNIANPSSQINTSTKLTFKDKTAPTYVANSISAPAGQYEPGDSIPISVQFSEPVKASTAKLTVNETEVLSARESGSTYSTVLTFLYEVKTGGNTFVKANKITGAQDLYGNTIKDVTLNVELCKGMLSNARLLDAVDNNPDISAGPLTFIPSPDGLTDKTVAQVSVTLKIPPESEKDLRDKIYDTYQDPATSAICNSLLAASMDGGKTLVPLVIQNPTAPNPSLMTATVEVDAAELVGFAGEARDFIMEFYKISVDAKNQVTKGDLVFGRYVPFSVKKPIPLTGDKLSIETPPGWPTDVIYANSPPEDAALTLRGIVEKGDYDYTWSQTRWVSSDETIATISAGGVVHPLKSGTVSFWLEAVNGNQKEYAGQRSDPVTLEIREGAEPYLRIPESEMTIRSGDPVTLRWASNLVQKNAEYADGAATTFHIEVTGPKGYSKEYDVTYDPANQDEALWVNGSPNQSFTINGLTEVDASGYTITLSAEADDSIPGALSEDYTATAHVTVISKPVSVKLERPEKMFVVNRGSLTVNYTLEDFDVTNGAEFKLVVTDNENGTVVYQSNATGEAGGSFPIHLSEAKTNGFRTIYDVSIWAKNAAETDWSRDSFTLYIYDAACLDILVQPVEKDRVVVDGDTVIMNNEKWISGLNQDQILALNRDIDLQTVISINYGAHLWSEAIDRLNWLSENSEIAAVNYPQGAYYENVEGLPNPSYAPASQFLLSGKNSGETVVEAIHALAGEALSSSVKVSVETLQDKLYLFQFYPATSGITMTYTNGDGVLKGANGEVVSDSQGRFAIYEPNGIDSDVYVKAELEGEVYLGTVYQEDLVSQEKDAVSLELYPLNSLTLRKVATLPVYLKKPDGSNYDGQATVRAGVYRNGVYCEQAMYTTTAGDKPLVLGTDDYKVSFDKNGKATFYYDLTQFNTSGNTDPVTAADDIQFVLELRVNGYYPILFTANGTTNEDDAIRMSERIVNLEIVPAGETEKPFVARQAVYFSGEERGIATNVRNKDGKIGPSTDYPELLLSTTVFWWGSANTDAKRTLQYIDGTGRTLTGQQQSPGEFYPFCSMPVSHSTVKLDKAQMKSLGMADYTVRTVSLQYQENDTTVKNENMRWQLINISLGSAIGSKDLMERMKNLTAMIASTSSDGVTTLKNDFLAAGISLVTATGIKLPFLKLQLHPTQDPTVFRGLAYLGLNNFEGDNVSGVDADTSRGYDLDYFPGYETIKNLYKQGASYGGTMGNQVAYAGKMLAANIRQMSGTSLTGDRKINYALQGCMETEVYYDFDDNQWKVVVVTGSLTAGGGMGYEWTWNTQVGPVPVFLQLEAGAAGALEFQAAVDRERGDNDYLTELRLYAYLQAFGGIGFDYAVLALKVGLYGRVGLDATLRWLNAIDQSAKFGAEIGMEGEIGVKLQVEVLFISYEKILWSQPIFNYSGAKGNWKEIDAYWERVKDGNSGYGAIVSPSSGRMRASLVASNADTGMGIYAADQDAALIDRDYLSEYRRSYDSSGPSLGGGISPFARFSSQENSAIRKTFRNSYPQAAPVLSDDGAYLFYLSDGNDASDATNVRAAVMLRNDENGYAGGGTINADGYGDSGLRAAGSGENAVAVWSRVMEKPDITEPGQKVTPDVQSAMMASSDIMVAVQDGSGGWRVMNLTENNGMADLSPVVAAKDDHILVAWRQVASSDAVDLTRFNAKDYIMYRYSDNGGESWSEARSVYNGTSGAVKGLEAAMMPDGTAAVTFTLQTGEHDAAGGKYHQEIAYAILGQTAASGEYDVLRYVQMTDDENLDENPQIAAVSLDGGDSSIFVLGWYSLSGDSGSDIRLAAVDRAGNRITGFVDSLSSLIQNAEVGVSANFQFSKNAASLDDLSILWSDTAAEDSVSGEPTHDYLSAIRFRTTDGQRISVTAAQQIVKMDAYTAIDNFNAYVGKDKNLYAAIQGTYYDYENPKSYTVTYPDGSEREVSVAQELTSIYTVVGAYTDTLRVDSVIPDYANIRKGASLPVQISVTNLGTQPMNKVEVEIGDDQASVFQTGRGDAFVAIAPGETRSLTVYYTVPATGAIPNPGYRITGTFADGSSDSSDLETLILNIPDLGIASSDILVNAANGNRTLQFNLYNLSDAELNGSGRIVKFNLYSDPECTQAIDPQYLTLVKKPGTKSGDALLTVSGDDLDAVDKDSFTLQYEFHLSEYIKQTEESADGGTIAMFADENGEVRDGGVTVYAKAWIELPGQTEDGGGEMLEYNSSNNVASVDLVSLLKQANGKPTTVTSTLDNSGAGSVVNVILQNNSMVKKTTGNVIVTLYDAQDNVVGVQQRYRKDGVNYGLLSLDPEAIQLEKFIFDKPGVRAEVAYGNLALDDPDNTELCHLVFSGICELADFVQAEDGNYTASVTVSQLSSTTITAMTANPDATVTVNGREVKPGEGLTQELDRGENVLVLVVTTESGASVTYTLTVQNNYPSGGGIGFAKYPVKVPAETEHGAVTVKPDRAKQGDTVTITAEPDEGYQVGSVTVLTSNGDEVAVTKKAEGVYTFVMPDCTVEVTVTFIPENRSQWINPFLDVSEDAWYYDAVRYVNEQGLMAGTGADTFSPDVTTTRGMIVTILYRLEGSPDMEDEIWGYPFADVDADAWYAAAVYWARMHGIVSGYSDELFGPDDVITREQMAAILYRYAQYKGYDTAARADLSRYTDGAQVSSWALDPIRWANAEGLVNGTSDTTLSPRGSATRAQVAAILTRFCQNVVK